MVVMVVAVMMMMARVICFYVSMAMLHAMGDALDEQLNEKPAKYEETCCMTPFFKSFW
jgi:hypothetical protein